MMCSCHAKALRTIQCNYTMLCFSISAISSSCVGFKENLISEFEVLQGLRYCVHMHFVSGGQLSSACSLMRSFLPVLICQHIFLPVSLLLLNSCVGFVDPLLHSHLMTNSVWHLFSGKFLLSIFFL